MQFFKEQIDRLDVCTKLAFSFGACLVLFTASGLYLLYIASFDSVEQRQWGAVVLASTVLICAVCGFAASFSVTRSTNVLISSVEALADGGWQGDLPFIGHRNTLGRLARSIQVIQAEAAKVESQRWLKGNLVTLLHALQTVETKAELGAVSLKTLAEFIPLVSGAFYLVDQTPLSACAVHPRAASEPLSPANVSLFSHCITSGLPLSQAQQSADYDDKRVASPNGGYLILLPVRRGDKVQAVLELVTSSPFEGALRALLDAAVPIIAMNLEIVTRHNQTASLLQQNQRANFLTDIALDLTTSGYWVVDFADPDYYFQSERAARLLGEPIKEDGRYHLQNDWFARLLDADPAIAQLTIERYHGTVAGRYPVYDAVYAYRRPLDGEVIWLHAVGKLERDESTGAPRFMYGVYQNITAQKRAEDELRVAREDALEAARAKGQFLANMSHEIRTPMNAIIGMTYLALQSSLDARQRNYLEKVQRAGKHLLGVMNDILDFSKIEAGRMTLEQLQFELAEVLEGVADMALQRAEDKGLELQFISDHALPSHVIGDPLRLGQVLLNLVNNAVKFTEHGAVTVSVQLGAMEAEHVLLKFEVRDTGIGMTNLQREGLFRPFSQADESTTRRYGGTGLGLVICRELLALMQGRIWVESQPARGTTVHFEARFALPVLDASPPPTSVQSMGGGGKSVDGFLNARVLLVEDNSLNQELAADLLVGAGMNVVLAENGAEALAILSNDVSFDLVLMDCQMPVMDGYQTASAIRTSHSLDTLPIIALTANATQEERERMLAAGMCDRITKPIQVSDFFKTIALWLGGGKNAAYGVLAERAAGNVTAAWQNMPGFNAAVGLARCNGQQRLYRRLLRLFKSELSVFSAQLDIVPAPSVVAELANAMHRLKAAAGSVGAEGVQHAAEALEVACTNRCDTMHWDTAIDTLRQALAQATMSLSNCAGLSEECDPVNLVVSCGTAPSTTLRALVAAGELDALQLWEAHIADFRNVWPQHWAAIGQDLACLRFELALAGIDDALGLERKNHD